MKNHIALVASLCIALTACSGGDDSKTETKEKTVSLDGKWKITVKSNNLAEATAKGVLVKKTLSDGRCVVTGKLASGEKLGDHSRLYFPHYTWHVTDKTKLSGEALPSNWFSKDFVTNWCEKDGYKAVSKTTMTSIINKLNELKWGQQFYPNKPCELKEFKSDKIALSCKNGLTEQYLKNWSCSAKELKDSSYYGSDKAYIHLSKYKRGGKYDVKKSSDGKEVTGKTQDGTTFVCKRP